MAGFIAACGLNCKACDAYIATQTNNSELVQQIAVKWGKQYGVGTPFPVESTTRDGCLTGSVRKGGYCGQCPVRACAVAKGVETCGRCPEYGCATLETFFGMAPMMREGLEKIRKRHPASRAG